MMPDEMLLLIYVDWCVHVWAYVSEYANTRIKMRMFDRRFVSAVFALIHYSCEHEYSWVDLIRRIIFKRLVHHD